MSSAPVSDFSRTPQPHRSSARANAATVRSMSASVVRQPETESRIAARPSQVVPLIHASPLACTAASAALVVASSAKRKSTWLRTTSFSTSQPGSSAIRSANAPRVAAAALDEVGDAAPAELRGSPRRPGPRARAARTPGV